MVAIRGDSSYKQEQKVAVEGILEQRLNRVQFRGALPDSSTAVSTHCNSISILFTYTIISFPASEGSDFWLYVTSL
jgi:hypothetical protein